MCSILRRSSRSARGRTDGMEQPTEYVRLFLLRVLNGAVFYDDEDREKNRFYAD